APQRLLIAAEPQRTLEQVAVDRRDATVQMIGRRPARRMRPLHCAGILQIRSHCKPDRHDQHRAEKEHQPGHRRDSAAEGGPPPEAIDSALCPTKLYKWRALSSVGFAERRRGKRMRNVLGVSERPELATPTQGGRPWP